MQRRSSGSKKAATSLGRLTRRTICLCVSGWTGLSARWRGVPGLLGEECPPRNAGRAVRSSALYHEWADLKARFAAIIEPETPFDSASPDDWERVSMRYQRS